MSAAFWVGLIGVVVIAAVSIGALLIIRARGRRLPPQPDGDRVRAEAQELRELGRRDGYMG